jgi:hypothetical protein
VRARPACWSLLSMIGFRIGRKAATTSSNHRDPYIALACRTSAPRPLVGPCPDARSVPTVAQDWPSGSF